MEKAKRLPSLSWQAILKLGRDDPRRVIHALKVGFALTLVSLLYLLELLSKGIGQNAVWAVMTVALVLEFTAGATLCKGLNRGLGTVAAGTLILFMEMIASECGKGFRAILIGGSVFVIGAAATYLRFVPYIKKNFDYGVVIFLLTFNLFAVSTYRSDNVLKIVHERFYTIVIGCCICLAMSLLVFPNWSGEDLHNSTVNKLEGLSKSVEACVSKYFNEEEAETQEEESDEDPVYKGYIAVLDSKSSDETLALHARWEPRHSTYKFPGKQYVKLGAVLRHFGYTIVALHGCMQTEIKTPRSVRALFKDPCTRLAGEVSKALLELANSIRHRRQCSPEILSDHLNDALKYLNIALLSQPKLFLGPPRNEITYMQGLQAQAAPAAAARISSGKTESSPLFDWRSSKRDSEKSFEPSAEKKVLRPTLSKLAITSLEFSEALPFAAFASLLVESVARLDRVIYEVEELGRIASFKKFKPGDEVVLTVKRHNVEENAAMYAE